MEKQNQVLLLVATGVFMSTLDSSMLNVALPSIMQSFGSTLGQTEWVILVYLLTVTIMLLFWGHLSRRYTQMRIYTSGALIFAVGSLLCSLGSNIYLLVFFRFIQAMGASMMMSMGPALIKKSFPREHLGKGLGLIGVATSLGLMSGPAISGVLIRFAHWRFLFVITVPIGMLVYFFGKKTCGTSLQRSTPAPAEAGKQPFDRAGALLWSSAICVTLLVCSYATNACCSSAKNNQLLATGAFLALALWVLLLINERRQPAPLLPVVLFKQRFFVMAMLSSMLSFCVLFFVLLLTPFYLRVIKQLSPDQTGFVMMALPLCVFFVSPVAGRLHDHIGARIVATAGLLICFVALLLLTLVTEATSSLHVALLLAVLGFGQAMFLSPNSAATLAGVNHQQAGVTSSLLATARNIGMLSGTALAGLIFSIYFARLTGGLDMKDFAPQYTEQFIIALRRSFQTAAALGSLAIIASWLRGVRIK